MGKPKTPTADLQIEHVPIDALRPDPANPRRIADAELEALTRSIRQFGLVDPIIARHDDGIVSPSGGGGLIFYGLRSRESAGCPSPTVYGFSPIVSRGEG